MTENHDYDTPSKGTVDWNIPLNDNFELIDTDVEIRDERDNLGQYAPKQGAKFVATDSLDVFFGAGDQWQHVAMYRWADGGLYVRSSQPGEPVEDDVWFDLSAQEIKVYDGSSWVVFSGGTTGGGGGGGTPSGTIYSPDSHGISPFRGEDLEWFTISTANPIQGAQSLRGVGDFATIEGDPSTDQGKFYPTIVSLPGDGLPYYPQAGDSMEFKIQVSTDNTYGGALWGVQNAGTWESPERGYRLRIDTGASPGVELEKVTDERGSHFITDPSSGQLSEVVVEPTIGEVYTVRVDWNRDGTMPYDVVDSDGNVLAADASPTPDTEWTAGGVGVMMNESFRLPDQKITQFDGFRVV